MLAAYPTTGRTSGVLDERRRAVGESSERIAMAAVPRSVMTTSAPAVRSAVAHRVAFSWKNGSCVPAPVDCASVALVDVRCAGALVRVLDVAPVQCDGAGRASSGGSPQRGGDWVKAVRLVQGEMRIEELPTPTPRYDEALIRMSSAGVCHSDLHIVRGDWAGVPTQCPSATRASASSRSSGRARIATSRSATASSSGSAAPAAATGAAPASTACSGEPRHCAQAQGHHGHLLEEFCVYAKSLVKLPDSMGDEEAPLACGGLTAYGAVKKLLKHHILPGRRIAVIGAAGGLGHYAVQIASAFGYKVVGVDIGEERLAFVAVARRAHGAQRRRGGRGGPASSAASTLPRVLGQARRLRPRPADAPPRRAVRRRRHPRQQRRQPRRSARGSSSGAIRRSSTPPSAPCRTCASSSTWPPRATSRATSGGPRALAEVSERVRRSRGRPLRRPRHHHRLLVAPGPKARRRRLGARPGTHARLSGVSATPTTTFAVHVRLDGPIADGVALARARRGGRGRLDPRHRGHARRVRAARGDGRGDTADRPRHVRGQRLHAHAAGCGHRRAGARRPVGRALHVRCGCRQPAPQRVAARPRLDPADGQRPATT